MNQPTLNLLNSRSTEDAVKTFRRCCGSTHWCEQMASARPFATPEHAATSADVAFDRLVDADWLEAFAAHPRIGDFESLKMKYAGNKEWSAGEQAGAAAADDATLHRLAEGNAAYEARFGYRFIVCATGKSAAQMLQLLESRLGNDPGAELRIAADEQRKITHLRLAKLEAG